MRCALTLAAVAATAVCDAAPRASAAPAAANTGISFQVRVIISPPGIASQCATISRPGIVTSIKSRDSIPGSDARMRSPMARNSVWWVRFGAAAAATCCLAAGSAPTLFDRGPVGFTDQQARRGQMAYAESCAMCHGPHLNDGQFGPPVKGAAFKARWHDQSADSLWSTIIRRMPPTSPGSLDSRIYTDIEAYLLRENGEAVGSTALAPSLAPVLAAAPVQAGAAPERNSAAAPPAAPRLANEDAAYRAAMAARKALLSKVTPVSDAMLRTPG